MVTQGPSTKAESTTSVSSAGRMRSTRSVKNVRVLGARSALIITRKPDSAKNMPTSANRPGRSASTTSCLGVRAEAVASRSPLA